MASQVETPAPSSRPLCRRATWLSLAVNRRRRRTLMDESELEQASADDPPRF